MSKKITILLIILATITVIAVVVPLLKSDGLSILTADERMFGEFAMSVAYQNFDNPIQRIFIMKVRVSHVTKQVSINICDIDDRLGSPELVGDYSATVDFLTFFGIRLHSESINCNG